MTCARCRLIDWNRRKFSFAHREKCNYFPFENPRYFTSYKDKISSVAKSGDRKFANVWLCRPYFLENYAPRLNETIGIHETRCTSALFFSISAAASVTGEDTKNIAKTPKARTMKSPRLYSLPYYYGSIDRRSVL